MGSVARPRPPPCRPPLSSDPHAAALLVAPSPRIAHGAGDNYTAHHDEASALDRVPATVTGSHANGGIGSVRPRPPVSTTLSSGPHMVFSPPTPLGRRKRASVTCSTSRRNPQRTAARGRKKPDQTTRGPGRDANEARPVRERITPERAGARAEAGSRATFACRGRGGGPGSARSRTAAAGRGRRAARAARPAPWPATGLRCANMAPTKDGNKCATPSRWVWWPSSPRCPPGRRRRRRRRAGRTPATGSKPTEAC